MLQISKADILRRLHFDNPWWNEGKEGRIAFEDDPRRKYYESFFSVVTDRSVRRAVVLMGPRRVGKTVMIYHAIRALIDKGVPPNAIMYLSMETPIYTGLSLEQLLNDFNELFGHTRGSKIYVFFDEIQYLRDWEVHLKSLVDSYPEYKFIASGSAAAALRLKSTESGAGRFSDFILPPLTFAEYLCFINREEELVEVENAVGNTQSTMHVAKNINELNLEFVNYLNFGGYPEAVFSKEIRRNPGQYIKSDIIDKVLLRDLPSLYGIANIQELNRLFTTLAYNTGQEINLDGLSKSASVTKNTIKRYLEYLEAAFLIRNVERIDQNAKRFKRATQFKVYLTNPSMRAALFGQVNEDSREMGSLTETAVFSQWQHSQAANLYYASWRSGEVDIVSLAPRNQKPTWAVEVKWSDRAYKNHSELDNCVDFVQRNPGIQNRVLFTTRTIQSGPITYKGVVFDLRPASVYAYTLGANILGNIQKNQSNEVAGKNEP